MEQLKCPSCGGGLVINDANGRAKCGYCGVESFINEELKRNSVPENFAEIEKSSKSAIAFMNSLNVEVRGQRASLVEMWNSIVSNRDVDISKITQFYKNLKTQILFCINAYNRLSDDIKYEVGEFTCAQMDSIIRFRKEHNFIYLDELDEIDAYIKKLNYDYGARSFFQFSRKRAIKNQIARVGARKDVVLYDYTMKAMDEIVAKYNSKIEPLKSEYNATSAHKRKKELKDAIAGLEETKTREIDSLGVKEVTKAYNKAVKKFNIQHEDLLKKNIVSARDSVGGSSAQPAKKVVETINYAEMDTKVILDELLASIDKLSVGVTKSEIEKCKCLTNELANRAGKFDQEATVYANAVVQSMEMVFQREGQPMVLSALLQSMGANAKTQIRTLKGKLND